MGIGGRLYWSFYSEKDPRWNCSGTVDFWAVSAGLPDEAKAALNANKKKYGKQPKDLSYSAMKE